MAKDCQHDRTNSWWEYDREGIELARVCDQCRQEQLRRFNPAVLTDEQCEVLGLSLDRPVYRDVVDEPVDSEEVF